MKLSTSNLAIFGLAAFLFACGGKSIQLDRRTESEIGSSLSKRKELVRGNPLYLTLVADLEKGRSQLDNSDLQEAFRTFGDILKNTRYINFPEYSFAKYYMALTLEKMGASYGALLYFVDIVEKEPLRVHTHESLRRAIQIAQKLHDDELILYLASVIPPNKVPKSLTEEFRYYIAKDLYQKKDYDRSARLLATIPRTHRMYLAARYLMGVIDTQRDRYRDAIEDFTAITQQSKRTAKYYEDYKIRQLTSLALGRLFYESKNYPLAFVHYRKVDRKSEYFPQALYESSWGLFKIHKFNEALSVLHSVNSPFFEQIYYLKSYMLKGAIFLELCLYQDAVGSLTEAEREFVSVGKQIDQFVREGRPPQQYYQGISAKRPLPNGKLEYRYLDLFNLAAENPDFRASHRYIQELQGEQKTLNAMNYPRAKLIASLIRQKEQDVINKASYLAGQKMKLTKELVNDFFQMKDILRYEIVSSERKILQTRSLRLAPPVLTDIQLIKPKFTESLRETLVWWDYDGEYWKDELGYYLYGLKSLCKDSADALVAFSGGKR